MYVKGLRSELTDSVDIEISLFRCQRSFIEICWHERTDNRDILETLSGSYRNSRDLDSPHVFIEPFLERFRVSYVP